MPQRLCATFRSGTGGATLVFGTGKGAGTDFRVERSHDEGANNVAAGRLLGDSAQLRERFGTADVFVKVTNHSEEALFCAALSALNRVAPAFAQCLDTCSCSTVHGPSQGKALAVFLEAAPFSLSSCLSVGAAAWAGHAAACQVLLGLYAMACYLGVAHDDSTPRNAVVFRHPSPTVEFSLLLHGRPVRLAVPALPLPDGGWGRVAIIDASHMDSLSVAATRHNLELLASPPHAAANGARLVDQLHSATLAGQALQSAVLVRGVLDEAVDFFGSDEVLAAGAVATLAEASAEAEKQVTAWKDAAAAARRAQPPSAHLDGADRASLSLSLSMLGSRRSPRGGDTQTRADVDFLGNELDRVDDKFPDPGDWDEQQREYMRTARAIVSKLDLGVRRAEVRQRDEAEGRHADASAVFRLVRKLASAAAAMAAGVAVPADVRRPASAGGGGGRARRA